MARKTIDEIRKIVEALIRKVNSRCPFKIAEHLNILVFHLPLDEVEGLWLHEKRIKAIILNKGMSLYRQRLVCSHELGHAIMHYDINEAFMRAYTHLSTDRYEIEANFFAFELEFNNLDEDITWDGLINRYGLNKEEITLMYKFLEGQRKLGDYDYW